MDKSLPWIPRLTHMDNFSLLRTKFPIRLGGPIIHRSTFPGMIWNMKNQNERKEWNKRWRKQIAIWHAEAQHHLDEAKILLELIKLAKSQIKRDPPE